MANAVNAVLDALQAIATWLDPEHHQGLWLMLTALVLMAAAIAAGFQVFEARRLRRAQIRPFVVMEFHLPYSSFIYLRFSNLGTTMARNVRFTFDRPLASNIANMKVMDLQILKSGIESLPPGRVIDTFFDNFIGRDEKDDRYVVTITYRGDGYRKPFKERMDLDLGLYRNTSPIRLKGLHEMHAELATIAKALEHFKASGGDGLLALSPEDLAERDTAWRAQFSLAQRDVAPAAPEPRRAKRAKRSRRPAAREDEPATPD